MIDPTPLWDFDDAPGSEERLRATAEQVEGDDRLVLMTQVADRTCPLRSRRRVRCGAGVTARVAEPYFTNC